MVCAGDLRDGMLRCDEQISAFALKPSNGCWLLYTRAGIPRPRMVRYFACDAIQSSVVSCRIISNMFAFNMFACKPPRSSPFGTDAGDAERKLDDCKLDCGRLRERISALVRAPACTHATLHARDFTRAHFTCDLHRRVCLFPHFDVLAYATSLRGRLRMQQAMMLT